jgi:hypothetical protein
VRGHGDELGIPPNTGQHICVVPELTLTIRPDRWARIESHGPAQPQPDRQVVAEASGAWIASTSAVLSPSGPV